MKRLEKDIENYKYQRSTTFLLNLIKRCLRLKNIYVLSVAIWKKQKIKFYVSTIIIQLKRLEVYCVETVIKLLVTYKRRYLCYPKYNLI